METIYDLVSSLIPDEQKDDIKSQIDGLLEKEKSASNNKLKKELSTTYGVNFFEEDITKAYSESAYVKKDKFEELQTTLNAQTTELEGLRTKDFDYEQINKLNDTTLKLVGEGLRVDRIELVKPFITGSEDDVKIIKEKYPELFGIVEVKGAFGDGKKKQEEQSEADLYFKNRAKQLGR